jgi:ankyrin repeat protein
MMQQRRASTNDMDRRSRRNSFINIHQERPQEQQEPGDVLSLNDACEAGDLEQVKIIVEAPEMEADLTEIDDINWTPLHFAIRGGNVDVVRYLIDDKGADLDSILNTTEGQEALNFAIKDGCLEIVNYLAENGGEAMMDAKNGDDKLRPLHLACLGGQAGITRYLVESHSVDVHAVDTDGWTAVHYASLAGDLDSVRFLVEEQSVESDVAEVDGWTPLHCASKNGHIDIVKYLVEDQHVDCDALVLNVQQNALHLAASEGYLDVVQYLVEEQGFLVNSPSSDGDQAIHLAASFGQLDILKYFIETHCGDDNQARFNMLFSSNEKGENAHDITVCRIEDEDEEYANVELVDYLESYVAPLAVPASADDGEPCVKLNPELTEDQRKLAEETFSLIQDTEVHAVAHHIMGYLCLLDVRR